MNLRIKIILAIFALGTIAGCDSLIYDNYEDCPQGVYVNIYSKTPCAEDSIYPSVELLKVFAFDKKGILAAQKEVQKPTLSKDFEILFPLPAGTYTFIAWTDVDEKRYTIEPMQIGKTTLNDVFFEIKRSQIFTAEALPTPGYKVYMGESELVEVPEASEYGTIYKHTKVNILEQTNRINVSVIGAEDPERYEISVHSANGSMKYNGQIVMNTEQLNYPSEITVVKAEERITAKFNTLKLQTGYNNILSVYDKREKKTVFKADLIGSILLSKGPNGEPTNINLDCTHDFNVKLYVKDVCDCDTYTFIACEVNLIKWDIHSYNIDFGDTY